MFNFKISEKIPKYGVYHTSKYLKRGMDFL